MPLTISDETALSEFLSVWQRQAERGQDVRAERLCPDRPELIPELTERIEALRRRNGLRAPAGPNAGFPSASPTCGDPHSGGVPFEREAADPESGTTPITSAPPAKDVDYRTVSLNEKMASRPHTNDKGRTYDVTTCTDHVNTFTYSEKPAVPVDAKGQPSIPGCEILGELGRGGMGVVYWVWQSSLNRTAALKMLLAGIHSGSEALARFHTETQAIARLQHSNIVQVFEVGTQDCLPYLMLEYVDGGSLAGKLAEGPFFPHLAARLAETLARAVYHAHQRGVIHRDLKPSNVLLTADGVPKITDFGLAKILSGGDESRTHSGAIMGTPSYMAPEQAAGKTREVGPATDIYALGAILYAMLTSHPPFQGTTLVETLEHVQSLEPVPPRRLQVKVPRDLETICLKCLQKNPRQRYLNAEALADDLHRFLAAEPIQARPTPLWERGMKWARRRPALAALLHVSVAAVLTVLSLSLWYNALLQTSLTETRAQKARGDEEHIRADEEHTQVEEHRARQGRRLQTLREAGQELLLAGQEAMGRLDWLDAKYHLGQAQAKLGSAPELADLQAHVERRLTETERQLEEQAGQRAATNRYRQFVEFHDKALFHGTLFMGMDERFNLTEAVSLARQALGLFGLTESAPTVLKLPPRYLSAGEKDEITAKCYELFLLVGEAVAHPLPGQGPGEHRAHAREALGILDRARTLRPATHAYHLRRVKYLAVVGDKEGEEAERRQAQAVPPTTASDFFLVGDQDYKAGNVAAALDHFHRALHLDPEHFWARYFAAVCLLEIGRHQEAIAYLTACASSRPAFPWIYVLRGHAYDELLDFGTAAADFQKAVQLNPAKYAAEYGIYVNRGAMRIHQRKFDEAVADLQRAIKLKPKLRQGYINLAEIDRQRKQYDQALRHLNEALRLDPKLARVYWLRAHVYREQQALPAALADLDDAVRFEAPGSRRLAVYHFERGQILHHLKKFEAALAAYRAVLTIDPDHAEGLRMSADVLLAMKRGAEARAAFDRYLPKNRPDADAYRLRGVERARIGDHSGAIADYSHALEIEPSAAATRARRGWEYLNGAAQLALSDFETAIRAEPRNGELYNGRGYAQVQLGKYREGVEDADEALRRGPLGSAPNERMALTRNAACVYAQAAGKLMASAEPDRAKRVQRYTERAVELLRQALAVAPPASRPTFLHQALADPAFFPIDKSPPVVDLKAEYALPKQ